MLAPLIPRVDEIYCKCWKVAETEFSKMSRQLILRANLSGHWCFHALARPLLLGDKIDSVRRLSRTVNSMYRRKRYDLRPDNEELSPSLLQTAKESLSKELDIPEDLASVLVHLPSAKPWIRELDKNASFCSLRVEHLVEKSRRFQAGNCRARQPVYERFPL